MSYTMLYENPVALGIKSAYRDDFENNQPIAPGTEGYIWRSKDERRTPVSKMATGHIENNIAAINRGAIAFETTSRKRTALTYLQEELDKRDELPF